jgi:hypothetical protein
MCCGVDLEVAYASPSELRLPNYRQRLIEMLKTPETSNQMPNRPDRISANSRLTPEQRTQAAAPKVGILFVHDEYPWIDSTPLEEAVLYGDVLNHDKGHDAYWEELQASGSVPRDEEYDECSRGRVCYDTKSKTFHLYLDRCILKRKEMVERIIRAMNLPPGPLTEIELDSHYRCPGCMHRLNE